MILIGIDPGISGAIAMLGHAGEMLNLADMPIMQHGKGTVKNQVNGAGLAGLLREWTQAYSRNEIMVLFEIVRAMPKQGVASTFSLGHTAGVIEGVVMARGYPHEAITPMTWKKPLGIGSDKERARTMAQRFFPNAPLSRAKDHNRAEALLIARFGWGKYA